MEGCPHRSCKARSLGVAVVGLALKWPALPVRSVLPLEGGCDGGSERGTRLAARLELASSRREGHRTRLLRGPWPPAKSGGCM